ncbi:MAG: hypothetical protein HQ473_07700 [Cryomorphaceae bacterium]|nr:hypothetical protein [Cryomorphaceae bacterium]
MAVVRAVAFDEEEIAVGVRLQAGGELVDVLADLAAVVEALVEIGFAIAVEVVEAGDLVAA